MKPKSQKEKILDYIRTYGCITDNDARRMRINRLAARIKDLRDDGYDIVSDIISYQNEDRRTVRYASYRLKK